MKFEYLRDIIFDLNVTLLVIHFTSEKKNKMVKIIFLMSLQIFYLDKKKETPPNTIDAINF